MTTRSAISQRRRTIRDMAYSLRFNGIDASGQSAASIDFSAFTNGLTIAFWLQINEMPGSAEIITESSVDYNGNPGSFLLSIGTSGALTWSTRMSGGGYNSFNGTQDITDGIEHRIILTRAVGVGAGATKIYIDRLISEGSNDNNATTEALTEQIVYIMARAGASLFAKGVMSQMEYYDGVWTPAEVADEWFDNVTPTDPSIEYPFNEGVDNTLTDIIGGKNITLTNPDWIDDTFYKTRVPVGAGTTNSVELDGVGDFMAANSTSIGSFNNGSVDSPFTTITRIKFNTLSGNQGIIAKDRTNQREWSFFMLSGGLLRFFLKNTLGGGGQQSIDTTEVLIAGKWYTLVTTYDGRGGNDAADGQRIFINSGVPDVPTNIIKQAYSSMKLGTAPIELGKFGGGSLAKAKFAEGIVYDFELTPKQVQDVMRFILPTNDSVSHWPIDENTGTNVRDISPNNNFQTFNGDPQWKLDNPRPATPRSAVSVNRASV